MTDRIEILNGTHKIRGRDVDLSGYVFPLVSEFRVGRNGGFVTVDARGVAGLPDRNIKIACNSADDYAYTHKDNTQKKQTNRSLSECVTVLTCWTK